MGNRGGRSRDAPIQGPGPAVVVSAATGPARMRLRSSKAACAPPLRIVPSVAYVLMGRRVLSSDFVAAKEQDANVAADSAERRSAVFETPVRTHLLEIDPHRLFEISRSINHRPLTARAITATQAERKGRP